MRSRLQSTGALRTRACACDKFRNTGERLHRALEKWREKRHIGGGSFGDFGGLHSVYRRNLLIDRDRSRAFTHREPTFTSIRMSYFDKPGLVRIATGAGDPARARSEAEI